MTPEQFSYWLQGFAELNPGLENPSPEQWKAIQHHLNTVFVKVTPPFPRTPAPPLDLIQKAIRDYPLSPYQITC